MSKAKKRLIIWLSVIVSILTIGIVTFFIVRNTAFKVDVKINAVQIDGSQKIKLNWKTSKAIDSMTVSIYHKNGNGRELVSSSTYRNPSDLYANQLELDAFYGRMTVEVSVHNVIYSTKVSKDVNLSASEYNIAPITATMPVTLFSLKLDEITNNGSIPTFVWFKRSGAWDWSNLPANVNPIPVANGIEFLNSGEDKMYSKTSAWIKELYEINKNSKFNLFYNDYYAFGAVQATVANGIPSENYHVTLLSDGSASFQYFNKHFNNENWETEYNKMAAQWTKLKKQVKQEKTYTKKSKFAIGAETLREYAYVMVNEEENYDWWLTGIKKVLAKNVPELQAAVENNHPRVHTYNLNSLLTALSEEQQVQLKKLYNFSDSMFEKAEKENKNVMIILGTWDENEYNFDDYVAATKAYYGDDYVYYYKGHPRNPTNSVSGKMQHLNSIGLIDVDSTIAAELILFFNPEAFVTGYESSTYLTATDEQSSAVFHRTKASAEADLDYYNKLKVFISVADANAAYGEFVKNSRTYLLEFKDTTNYDIALYDAAAKKITYYRLDTETSKYEKI